MAVPAASAHHWERDWVDSDDDLGDSGCEMLADVWSFFCSNPEHIPVADPIGPYPGI